MSKENNYSDSELDDLNSQDDQLRKPLLLNNNKFTNLTCWHTAADDLWCFGAFILAIGFTAGKMIQAGGANLFGVEKMFERYHWDNENALLFMQILLLTANGTSTLMNRGVRNFEYFLPPVIFIAKKSANINELSTLHQDYPRYLLRENYIIFSDIEGKLELRKIGDYKLGDNLCITETAGDVKVLYDQIENCDKIVLNRQLMQLLKKIKNLQSPVEWSYKTHALYLTILCFCLSTMLFSTMAAYLSSDTLAKDFGLVTTLHELFIWYATLSNLVSYGTFNIATMRRNITPFCESFEKGTIVKDNFHQSWQILIPVVSLTTFGMIANLAFAYYSMDNFFKMSVVRQYCPYVDVLSMICRYLNVAGTFFSGIFNMASGAYQIVENHYKKSQANKINFSWAGCSLSTIVVTDTLINSLNAFLGIMEIFDKIDFIGHELISTIIQTFFAVIFTMCYAYLTSGMMLRGAVKATQCVENNVTRVSMPFSSFFKGYSPVSSEDSQAPNNMCSS